MKISFFVKQVVLFKVWLIGIVRLWGGLLLKRLNFYVGGVCPLFFFS